MAEFDESNVSRDEKGQFAETGGSGHVERATRAAAEASKQQEHQAAADKHRAASAARKEAAAKEQDPNRRTEHLAQAAHHDARAAHHQVKADVEREVAAARERIAQHPVTTGLEHHAGASEEHAPAAEASHSVTAPGPGHPEGGSKSGGAGVPEKSPANDHAPAEHEAKLAEMEKLVSGSKKLSDRQIVERLGVTHEQALKMTQQLRDKHGVGLNETLRDKLREKAKGEKGGRGEKGEGKKGEKPKKEPKEGGGHGGGIGHWLDEKLDAAREHVESFGEGARQIQEQALQEGGVLGAGLAAGKAAAGAYAAPVQGLYGKLSGGGE